MEFCRYCKGQSCKWAWIDTCCIDKTSSAELSEAINSMFNWYKASLVCAVYLADVTDPDDLESFGKSAWFTRGWTLQELLAPRTVYFFTSDWQQIGVKYASLLNFRARLTSKISEVTGVPPRVLQYHHNIHEVSVARRMSWAAHRTTSRTEDMAYCLHGIFDINMPLLYGEGNKAFRRLQVQIMDQNDDDSLFAWQGLSQLESAEFGILAKHRAPLHPAATSSPSNPKRNSRIRQRR